jgi:hypothetical protein
MKRVGSTAAFRRSGARKWKDESSYLHHGDDEEIVRNVPGLYLPDD